MYFVKDRPYLTNCGGLFLFCLVNKSCIKVVSEPFLVTRAVSSRVHLVYL